ncbi:hypothetical protein P6U16_08520 [Rhizobium sp. 32-5/1]|uniref:hypothetical protein n=1 Tax=Rhizobium sp. 32-5/1 TaxID=3019602 RepID=UPI00240E2121|nr:hypothetical protein [Rhizobium sp. 32-5/1]WEZ84602.1 hypothetical protein P6U16_08520 [Rhizobium sp. 32-5/1]
MIRYRTSLTAVIKATPPRCIRPLVERMADDMREMACAGQNVSIETLIERGWTARTIERLSPDAISIARRQSIRQVA